MDYEKRYREEMIETYMKHQGLTREEAEWKFDGFKHNFPDLYNKQFNKWFDEVHPY